ncbi:oxidative stress induced growth inhibitor 1 [Engraulis encrasicolus]|uniref:oxidative stress induced growth inhibitor 1 n=1 Tax=Engraulis encrasicolus TaxID=184585 RepID=UPI002FD1E8A9
MDLYENGDILPVVVIGNGPSGICLSYLLSGYTPYLSPEGIHPNAILQSKLDENSHLSLLEQDLEYLCEGLEGRSDNPVAVLFDSLLLPDSDFGLDCASPLAWRYEPSRATPHLVLGKGPPGGAWHAMEGSMLTLSLANWMELPGLKLKDWMREKRRNVRNDRATPAEIASYYQHYVTQMGLESNFARGTVTSVQRIHLDGQEDGQDVRSLWEVQGLQKRRRSAVIEGGGGEERRNDEEEEEEEEEEVAFSVLAENVVLATGTHDIPARLGVEGEALPFVSHSFWELEAAIAAGRLDQASDPVLVVGAGLTAADAVLATHHLSVPVYHAFRRSVADPALIFNQLPKMLYPEYHKVHQMMTQQQHQHHNNDNDNNDSGPLSSSSSTTTSPGQNGPDPSSSSSSNCSSYPGYVSFPRHRVVSIRPDRKCVLRDEGGRQTVLQVSMVLVLIGAHPNLSFLPGHGRPMALDPEEAVSCRRNPLDVDPFTHEALREPGMYAMGPLVGENFVRFLKGGALAIASSVARKRGRRDDDGEGLVLSTATVA